MIEPVMVVDEGTGTSHSVRLAALSSRVPHRQNQRCASNQRRRGKLLAEAEHEWARDEVGSATGRERHHQPRQVLRPGLPCRYAVRQSNGSARDAPPNSRSRRLTPGAMGNGAACADRPGVGRLYARMGGVALPSLLTPRPAPCLATVGVQR